MNDDEDTPETLPSVDEAFAFVVPSYQIMLQRLDAMDSRLQALQTFAVTIAVVGAALATSIVEGIDVASVWFGLALGAGGLAAFAGSITRVMGSPKVISPDELFDNWISRSPWHFKKDLLAFAGDDFNNNNRLVKLKGNAAVLASGLVLLEAVFLVVWVLMER